MQKATVQSIADTLGLSKFAVSRALNGKSGVSDSTRRRVIETAERLGYTPRPGRRAQSSLVTVIFRDRATANRELWIDLRYGLEMQAMREGFETRAHYTSDPDEILAEAEASLAFVFVGPTPFPALRAAEASGRPVVCCAHELPPLLWIDQVTATDVESGAAVGEFLVANGHRDIVYLHGQGGFPGRHRRLDGLRRAVEGQAEVSVMSFTEDYAASEFVPQMRRVLERGARPTAFFCGSDGVAVTCLSEVQRLGLRVPADVSVIGHADYPIATQVSPHLTTVHVPHREIGIEAIELVRRRTQGPDGPGHGSPFRIALVCTLVERGSSGPAGAPRWMQLLGEAAPATGGST